MRSEALPPAAQTHAEGASALASRATRPPRHVADGHVALASQAAQARDAVNDSIIRAQAPAATAPWRGGAFRNAAFPGGQAVELLPILHRVAKNSGDHCTQPRMLFGQNVRNAAHLKALLVACEDRIAGILGGNLQARLANRDMRAGGQAHQIDGIGQLVDFVEIVDAPHQAAFHVAPGAEVFDVQIAHRQHVRRAALRRRRPWATVASSGKRWRAETETRPVPWPDVSSEVGGQQRMCLPSQVSYARVALAIPIYREHHSIDKVTALPC